MYGYRPYSADAETWRIALALSQVELTKDIEADAPKMLAILRGAGHRFNEIDEHEMYFNQLDGRFWMLRTIRNSPEWFPRLQAALRA